MRRPKVVPMDPTRRKKHWSLGDPPKPRRRRRRGWLKSLIWVGLVVYLGLSNIGDAAMGLTKGTTACKVVGVIDGDTVMSYCAGQGFQRTRLTGFDTPELFSPQCNSELWAASRAKLALKGQLWAAKRIAIEPEGRDRYDRMLARMTVDGQSIGTDLIARDLARPYFGERRRSWC